VYTFDVPLTATKLVAKVKQTTREEGEDVTRYVLLKWYVTCAIKSASGQVLAEGDRQLVLNETGDYNSGSEKVPDQHGSSSRRDGNSVRLRSHAGQSAGIRNAR
jgi:hypothetical protein